MAAGVGFFPALVSPGGRPPSVPRGTATPRLVVSDQHQAATTSSTSSSDAFARPRVLRDGAQWRRISRLERRLGSLLPVWVRWRTDSIGYCAYLQVRGKRRFTPRKIAF